jgi:hypothetical protein
MPPGTQDPELPDVLAEWMRAGLAKVHTAIPATVVVYNPALQSASVQPVLRARIDDVLLDAERPDIAPIPPIPNVPIVWPSGFGGAWSITGPLLPGDPVVVVVAERSLDEWKTTGAPDIAAQDARRFDLSDAFAIPGGRHFNPAIPTSGPLDPTAIDPAAVVIRGVLVKLGSGPAAIHQLLHGETFEADLATWLTALDLLLDALAAPGAPAAWVPVVQLAAQTFQTAHATFAAAVASGIHRSLVSFTE